MKREFETEQVMEHFKELFEAAYPDGCSKRQLSDLVCFFLGGYCVAVKDYQKAISNISTLEGAVLFMEEIQSDTIDRGRFSAECMFKNDFSHEMFDLGN